MDGSREGGREEDGGKDKEREGKPSLKPFSVWVPDDSTVGIVIVTKIQTVFEQVRPQDGLGKSKSLLKVSIQSLHWSAGNNISRIHVLH